MTEPRTEADMLGSAMARAVGVLSMSVRERITARLSRAIAFHATDTDPILEYSRGYAAGMNRAAAIVQEEFTADGPVP